MLCELEEAQLNTTDSRNNYRHHKSPSNVQVLIFIFERSARLAVFDLGKRFENTFWAVRFAVTQTVMDHPELRAAALAVGREYKNVGERVRNAFFAAPASLRGRLSA